MKHLLISLFLFTVIPIYSQDRIISGQVLDETQQGLPSTFVIVKNTEISTETDRQGYFRIAVPDSLTILVFYFLGYQSYEYEIQNEKEVEIFLGPESNEYRAINLSIGLGMDPINSLYGLTLGNVLDEAAFISPYDWGTDFFYKISGAIGFEDSHTFNVKIAIPNPRLSFVFGHSRPVFHRMSLEFSDFKLSSTSLSDRTLKFGAQPWTRLGGLEGKFGIRRLNSVDLFGGEIGIERGISKMLLGVSTGKYGRLWVFSSFLYSQITKTVYFRIAYERIDQFDFLRIGLNLKFHKRKKDKIQGFHRFK